LIGFPDRTIGKSRQSTCSKTWGNGCRIRLSAVKSVPGAAEQAVLIGFFYRSIPTLY